MAFTFSLLLEFMQIIKKREDSSLRNKNPEYKIAYTLVTK